jgi:hypothetical protein
MQTCLDTIVSVWDQTGVKSVSASGLDLFDAPEITIRNLADSATETYTEGIALAKDKLATAVTLVKNDFLALLAQRGFVTALVNSSLQTSTYQNGIIVPASNLDRGIIIKPQLRTTGISRIRISSIQAFPLGDSSNATLTIHDNGLAYSYPVQLVGGQINTFAIQHPISGKETHVYLNAPGVAFTSSKLACNCDGSMPAGWGAILGWNGTGFSSREGHGLSVSLERYCDYDLLLCQMAKSYLGEIVWLKARILLLEARSESNRLNNWVLYGREDVAETRADLESQYVERWNALVAALPALIQNRHDNECLPCRGSRWVANG